MPSLMKALSTLFMLFPKTNYRSAYPVKSAQEREEEAWKRTMRTWHETTGRR